MRRTGKGKGEIWKGVGGARWEMGGQKGSSKIQ